MTNIENLLGRLRQSRGMYIGAPLLPRLAFFLRGYDQGAEEIGGAPPDPFLDEFREWIYERLGRVNRNWEDLIIASAGGEREGFDRFWQLFDEFISERLGRNDEAVSATPKEDSLRSAAQ